MGEIYVSEMIGCTLGDNPCDLEWTVGRNEVCGCTRSSPHVFQGTPQGGISQGTLQGGGGGGGSHRVQTWRHRSDMHLCVDK